MNGRRQLPVVLIGAGALALAAWVAWRYRGQLWPGRQGAAQLLAARQAQQAQVAPVSSAEAQAAAQQLRLRVTALPTGDAAQRAAANAAAARLAELLTQRRIEA